MAKRNKKLHKKRKQRQLKKTFKQVQKVALDEAQKLLLKDDYLPPYKEPKENTNKKHEERNKAYQKALDKVYGGSVIPLANYANAKCTLLHKCTECNIEFYGKPGWLISKEDQKHVCGVNSLNIIQNYYKNHKPIKSEPKPTRIELSDKDKQRLCELFKSGVSKAKIARHFDISIYIVNKYLKEAGLK
ncbi:hypothetical protein COK01_26355 [Priestia megaterium]|uniref:hypothetical protein n=1 Tax=Priestia megaterium TaxID=1404 RepID=UPI000BFA08D7|nr:hypothetical protein [Priestia megaterium]PFP44840.1 hypothetical protein COK01_26355 [Priestia megaterium]